MFLNQVKYLPYFEATFERIATWFFDQVTICISRNGFPILEKVIQTCMQDVARL